MKAQSHFRGVLSLLLLVAVAVPSSQGQPEKAPLRWGADAEGGIPYIFASPADPNTMIGFEVDLKAALEKELDRKIIFRQSDFKNLVQHLDRGDIDFAMNGLEVTADRKEQVLFSRPYYHFQLQLATRADETRFDSLSGLKEIGGVVGTLDNTAASRYLEKRGITMRVYDDQQGPYDDLDQGELDGVLMDLPIAMYVAHKNQFNPRPPAVQMVGHIFGSGEYAIAIKKDNQSLKEELDAALQRLEEKGELRRIYQKWNLWQPGALPSGTFREFDEWEESERAEAESSYRAVLLLLLQGAWMTIQITVLGFLLAMAIGLPITLVRLYAPRPFSWLAIGYVEFFRGIPVLLLLAFLYFGLPKIGEAYGLGDALKLNAFVVAVLGFGLNYAAYEAEIYRAGISSIPIGQWEAASSLGMPGALTFRRIILPQAIRFILPPMTNDLVAMFKDTSVVSVIAVVELTKTYLILVRSSSAHLMEIALATAGLYLIMSIPLGLLSRYLEKRWEGQG